MSGNAGEAPIRVHFGPGFHAAVGRPIDRSAYDRYVGDWSRLFVPTVLAAAEVAAADRILDVATGPGEAAALALSQVGPAGLVVGADIALAMLDAAKSRLAGARFRPVVADGQALPFADGTFDAVLCQLGLMSSPIPPRACTSSAGAPPAPSCRRVRHRCPRASADVGCPPGHTEPVSA